MSAMKRKPASVLSIVVVPDRSVSPLAASAMSAWNCASGPSPLMVKESGGRSSMLSALARTPSSGSDSVKSMARLRESFSKLASRFSEPGRSRRSIERSVSSSPPAERDVAVDRQPRRGADHPLGDLHLGNVQLAQDHRDRQARQLELAGALLQRLVVLHRQRLARHGDLLGLEEVDRQPPAQQGEAGPDEVDVVETQPHALAIGDGDVAEAHVRGERAVDGAEPDLAVGRGDLPLDEAHEAARIPRPAHARSGSRSRRPRRKPAPQGRSGTSAFNTPIKAPN